MVWPGGARGPFALGHARELGHLGLHGRLGEHPHPFAQESTSPAALPCTAARADCFVSPLGCYATLRDTTELADAGEKKSGKRHELLHASAYTPAG